MLKEQPSVIKNNLAPKETIKQSAVLTADPVKYLAITAAVVFVLAILSKQMLLVGFASLGLLPAIIYLGLFYLRFKGEELALINQRAIVKSGFFSHHLDSMAWAKVESVTVDQGFLGRRYDYGSVSILGAGSESISSIFVSSPMQFRQDTIKVWEEAVVFARKDRR